MAAWWRPVTPCVILLHRSGVPMVPILGIQGVIKMTKKEFSRMEENSPRYYNFSDDKFMFKRTWQVVFWPESGKTGAKNKNKPLLYTDRLSRNGHRRKREWTLFVFSIYRKPYFFILWYSVVGFIFSNRAACSWCPLHIRRAFMMDFLSVFLFFLC